MAYLEDTQRRSAAQPAAPELRKKTTPAWTDLERWLPALILGAALLIWEGLVYNEAISALFFPPPSQIGRTLVQWILNGQLLVHLEATLFRIGWGFLLGGLAGLLLGVGMGWSPRLRTVIDPFIAAIHPLPKIAVLPLIMIIFGLGETSKVVVVAIATFFPMLINTMAGVQQIPPLYFEVAQNYGAGPRKLLSRIVIPASLPLILTGTRLAFNMALLVVIAVELVTAHEGLGAMIWLAWQTLRTEELYASLVIITLLGISSNFILRHLTIWLTPWHVQPDR